MRRIFVSIIGFMILASTLHFMPGSAMASDMKGQAPHCHLCSEEDVSLGLCAPTKEDDETPTFDAVPLNGDCDCSIDQSGGEDSPVTLFSFLQTSKVKVFAALPEQKSVIALREKRYTRFNQINAPPASFLVSLSTVRQLK